MRVRATHTILHLRGSDFFGSVEKLIAGQMRNLDEFYFSCASFKKPGRENQFISEMRRQSFASFVIDDRGLYDGKIPGRIAKLIKSNGINLLVSHDYKSRFYGHRAAKKAKIPHVAYFHGWTSEDFKVRFYNYIDKKYLKKAKRVVTVSKSSAYTLTQAGIPAGKINVVYNALRTELDVPPARPWHRPPVIGVVGRLSWEKGVHIFLQALASINGKAPEFKAEIYGDGPYSGKLQKLSRQLKIDNVVEFKGHQEDTNGIYDNVDFLVVPSLSEGHPLVILEAWARGLGIIASKAGGIPEIIENGSNGILVDTGNPELLGSAIKRGIEDSSLMVQHGRSGFDALKSKYSYEQQAQILTAIYNDVLGVSVE